MILRAGIACLGLVGLRPAAPRLVVVVFLRHVGRRLGLRGLSRWRLLGMLAIGCAGGTGCRGRRHRRRYSLSELFL